MSDSTATAREPSMEDILASIRRIIDEEDTRDARPASDLAVDSADDGDSVPSGPVPVMAAAPVSRDERARDDGDDEPDGESVFPERESPFWSRATGRGDAEGDSQDADDSPDDDAEASGGTRTDIFRRAQSKLGSAARPGARERIQSLAARAGERAESSAHDRGSLSELAGLTEGAAEDGQDEPESAVAALASTVDEKTRDMADRMADRSGVLDLTQPIDIAEPGAGDASGRFDGLSDDEDRMDIARRDDFFGSDGDAGAHDPESLRNVATQAKDEEIARAGDMDADDVLDLTTPLIEEPVAVPATVDEGAVESGDNFHVSGVEAQTAEDDIEDTISQNLGADDAYRASDDDRSETDDRDDAAEARAAEARAAEARAAEARAVEARAAEARAAEARAEEARVEEARAAEARAAETRAEEARAAEARVEEARAEEARTEERSDEPDSDESYSASSVFQMPPIPANTYSRFDREPKEEREASASSLGDFASGDDERADLSDRAERDETDDDSVVMGRALATDEFATDDTAADGSVKDDPVDETAKTDAVETDDDDDDRTATGRTEDDEPAGAGRSDDDDEPAAADRTDDDDRPVTGWASSADEDGTRETASDETTSGTPAPGGSSDPTDAYAAAFMMVDDKPSADAASDAADAAKDDLDDLDMGEELGFSDTFGASDVYHDDPPALDEDYSRSLEVEDEPATRTAHDPDESQDDDMEKVGGLVRDAMERDPVDYADPSALVSMTSEEISARALASLADVEGEASRRMFGSLRISDDGGSESLEGMVRGMLRPLLREWLDDNLPSMVETAVRGEVERISAKSRKYSRASDED